MSRMIRIPEHLDIVQALYLPALLAGAAPHHWNGRARKKTFVEAWLWAALVSLIFDNPFQISTRFSQTLSNTWKQIFGEAHCHNWPVPTSACELWRYTTAEQLRSSVDFDDSAEVHAECEDAASTIITAMEPVFPGSYLSELRLIVRKAYRLAWKMSLQRSRLQITYPAVGLEYSREEMTPVPDRDGEVIHEGIWNWAS